MVARVPWSTRPRAQKTAIVVMFVSTVDFLQSIVIGALSVPANMILYLIAHGHPPVRPTFDTARAPEIWAGHFLVILPWWYFAATGVIMLAVSVFLVLCPGYRFTPASVRTFAWRSTTGWVAIQGIFVALELRAVASYHAVIDGFGDPYLYGVYAAALGGLITLGAYLVERKRRLTGSRRPAKRKVAPRG